MKKLRVLSVLVLLGVTLATENLSDDLDSMSCSRSVEYSNGKILDIKKSVELGAELLVGTSAEDKDSCLSMCCNRQACDLALFKTDGSSKKGNNCYLVHCGDPENCLMVDLGSFDSMYLHVRSSKPDKATSPGNGNAGLEPNKDTSTATHSSSTARQTAAPPPTTSSRNNVKDTISTAPVKVIARTTSELNVLEVSTIHKPSTNPPPSTSSRNEEAKEQGSNNKDSSAKVRKNKPCGAYGCDGSGVVAVVVVAAVCTAIIIVVGAILLKKVVDDRRHKKFRNVDYLINGMYT